jgi:hypothetical protein
MADALSQMSLLESVKTEVHKKWAQFVRMFLTPLLGPVVWRPLATSPVGMCRVPFSAPSHHSVVERMCSSFFSQEEEA